jgi:hypothetical protein
LWSAAVILQIEPFPRSIPISFALAALVYVGDNIIETDHAKIMRANGDFLDTDALNSYLLDMQTAISIMDHSKVRSILEQAITGYRPHDTVVDHLADKPASEEPIKEPIQNNIVNLC